jgi:catechol 2,3-dioxygenase-like lactoylglutathione lyase family enzyme
MFQGLRTLTYGVKDLAAAKAWYTGILGFEPYFDQPFYVGYEVGGYELGLDPNSPVGTGERTGPLAYWGVDNIEAAFAQLVEKGAKGLSKPEEVGDGIKVAALSDPFGNVFGIIYNPHFKLPVK